MKSFFNSKDYVQIQKILDELSVYVRPRSMVLSFKSILYVNQLISMSRTDAVEKNLIRALTSLKREGLSSVIDLENKLKEIFIEKLKESNKGDYWKIIIPFNINIKKRKIILNDVEFKILSNKTISKLLNQDYYRYYFGERKFPIKVNREYSKFLIADVEATSHFNAYYSIISELTLLRGIIDFSLTQFAPNFLRSNTSRQTKIPHPNIFYFINEKNEAYYLETLSPKPDKFKMVNLDQGQSFKVMELISIIGREKKGSINTFLADCFRLYGQAMDQEYIPDSFLSFWQLSERLSLKDSENGKNQEVTKRLSFFSNKFLGLDLIETFQKFADKRNKLVHHGINNVKGDDVEILKYLNEKIIVWIIENRKKIKTIEHYAHYFKLKDLNTKTKTAIQNMINFRDSKI